jgi:hypothetical protein
MKYTKHSLDRKATGFYIPRKYDGYQCHVSSIVEILHGRVESRKQQGRSGEAIWMKILPSNICNFPPVFIDLAGNSVSRFVFARIDDHEDRR